jgi:hypothetical protein
MSINKGYQFVPHFLKWNRGSLSVRSQKFPPNKTPRDWRGGGIAEYYAGALSIKYPVTLVALSLGRLCIAGLSIMPRASPLESSFFF